MFILIIFFLATATFTEEERDIQVNLPQSAAARSTQAPKMIVINVRETVLIMWLTRPWTLLH